MQRSDELIESALEFLKTSCDEHENHNLKDLRRLKHSTITVCTGIELILKARLAREHWTLVLLSPDRYRQGDWERGSFQSVGLREAIARLSEVCEVNISEQAESAFAELADFRNKFVHSVCSESEERVTGIQLRAWHHLIDLLDHDLLQLSAAQEASLREIRGRMLKREGLLTTRFEEVGGAIAEMRDAGADILLCPFCGHPALAAGDGAQCLVCGSGKSNAQEYAEEYARRSAPWMSSDEFYNTQWAAMCSDCGHKSCVPAPAEVRERCEQTVLEAKQLEHEPGMDIEPWYCFNCASVYDSFDISNCTRCGQLFGRKGDETLCPDCSW